MSGVAGLFNVPTNDIELQVWATTHMTHHRDINRALYEITGANLAEYVLDPINPLDSRVWEAQHQLMHFNMDAVLGISGYDLTGVDFTNEKLLPGWIQLNANEHYQAANILNIG